MEGPESFIIEIEKEKVEGLLHEFDGDLSWLAQHLKLMNKRMVLINPKFQNADEQQPPANDNTAAEDNQVDTGAPA